MNSSIRFIRNTC